MCLVHPSIFIYDAAIAPKPFNAYQNCLILDLTCRDFGAAMRHTSLSRLQQRNFMFHFYMRRAWQAKKQETTKIGGKKCVEKILPNFGGTIRGMFY